MGAWGVSSCPSLGPGCGVFARQGVCTANDIGGVLAIMETLLEGITVLDLSRLLPGPFCSMILADLGADVIKVESTMLGDPTRAFPPRVGQESCYFMSVNRNKRSIAVNPRREEGREIVLGLAKSADVFLEGFRPGRAALLGLDYDEIRKLKPDIIYCSLSGYGQDGPLRDRAGHDINYVGLGGMLDLLRTPGGIPQVPRVQHADIGGGALYATIGILSALVARERSGTGSYIDASIFHGVVASLTFSAATHMSAEVQSQHGHPYLLGLYPCYNVYRTKDGRHMTLGALEPHFWADFCEAIGREDLISKQFPADNEREVVVDELQSVFSGRTRDEWVEFLADKDVCCEPVNTLEEALDHPQVTGRGMLLGVDHPSAGRLRLIGLPFRGSGEDQREVLPPPLLGQHTIEILESLGYDRARIAELRACRVVSTPADVGNRPTRTLP
jgi:crotonobetainyl-CoA:carnitine CoA-transferase CaiB-like acyl-CoA transferase